MSENLSTSSSWMTARRTFGKALNAIRGQKNISRTELAKRLGTSIETITEWEQDLRLPVPEIFQKIVKVLELNHKEAEYLDMAARTKIIPLNDAYDFKVREASGKELEFQLDNLKKQLAAIAASQENKSSQEDFRGMKKQIEQIEKTTQQLTAEVLLPPAEAMKVRLVTTTSLESLEEYRSDQGIWFAGGGLFIGAALGILVNWATGSEMTRTSGILIVTFIIRHYRE